MGKIIWHNDGRYTIDESMNRKEIARDLKKSEKQLRKEMKAANLFYDGKRIISPTEVKKIIEALGPPIIHGIIET